MGIQLVSVCAAMCVGEMQPCLYGWHEGTHRELDATKGCRLGACQQLYVGQAAGS